MSWYTGGEERGVCPVSPDSTITMNLVQCPDCPSPGLVPLTEMTHHIRLHHRGDGFRCAVCKVSIFVSFKIYLNFQIFSSLASLRTL